MSGYIPAGVNPKIGFKGLPPLTVPPSGLAISLGIGLNGQNVDTATLGLNSLVTDQPETFSLFVPGSLVAGNIGTWKNTRVDQKAGLVILESNLKTAAAGTPANCFNVVATDSIGAIATLPLSASGSHFWLNKAYNSIVAQANINATVFNNAGSGQGSWFTPTQTLTVAGVSRKMNVQGTNGGASPQIAAPIRATLMDSSLNVLGTSTVTAPASGFSTVSFVFPNLITLTSGHKYFIGFDIWQYSYPNGDPVTGQGYVSLNAPFNGTSQASPVVAGTGTTPPAGPSDQMAVNFLGVIGMRPKGHDWPWIFANDTGDLLNENGAQGWAPFGIGDDTAFLGGSGYALMTGDITFSVSTTGAPAAGTGGSDMNVRALLALA